MLTKQSLLQPQPTWRRRLLPFESCRVSFDVVPAENRFLPIGRQFDEVRRFETPVARKRNEESQPNSDTPQETRLEGREDTKERGPVARKRNEES